MVSQFQPPTEIEWMAFKEAMQVWEILKGNSSYTCSYISRELNTTADLLARKGREEGMGAIGFTYPTFKI